MFGGLGTALNPLNDLWKLDLQTTTWTSQAPYGPAPAQRRGASLTLAEQRVAYLFGGESSSNAVLNDLHLLHLGPGSSDGQPTPRWELITANVSGSGMPLARTEHSCTAAPLLNVGPGTDGMLLFGGVDNAGNALDDLHSLQFATLFWRTPNPSGVKPQKRKGHTTVLLLNSILALYGGSNPQTPVHYSDVHLLDIARNTWIQPALVSANNAPVGRDGHSMVTIGDVVYIFGGVSSQGEKLSDLWSFNAYAAVSGQLRWSKPVGMSSAPVPRWGHVGVGYAGDSMAIISGSGAGDLLLTDMHVISTGCSGDLSLTAARGVFSDGDGKYRNNLDCRWKIQPTLANTYVRVVVTQLELLDAGDKLEVYDGDALTSPLLASYTGSSIPPSLISSGKKLMVRLVTDAGETQRFQAAYQAVCAPGFTWDSVSASCKACPAGSYAGIAASTECTACPVGFYAPLPVPARTAVPRLRHHLAARRLPPAGLLVPAGLLWLEQRVPRLFRWRELPRRQSRRGEPRLVRDDEHDGLPAQLCALLRAAPLPGRPQRALRRLGRPRRRGLVLRAHHLLGYARPRPLTTGTWVPCADHHPRDAHLLLHRLLGVRRAVRCSRTSSCP